MDVIGVRHGEKIHETLATSEELARSTDRGAYFQIRLDSRGLDYAPYFEEGEAGTEKINDYGSDSTYQLTIEEAQNLLLRLPEIHQELTGQSA